MLMCAQSPIYLPWQGRAAAKFRRIFFPSRDTTRFFRKEAHLVPELVGPAAGQQEMIYLNDRRWRVQVRAYPRFLSLSHFIAS